MSSSLVAVYIDLFLTKSHTIAFIYLAIVIVVFIIGVVLFITYFQKIFIKYKELCKAQDQKGLGWRSIGHYKCGMSGETCHCFVCYRDSKYTKQDQNQKCCATVFVNTDGTDEREKIEMSYGIIFTQFHPYYKEKGLRSYLNHRFFICKLIFLFFFNTVVMVGWADARVFLILIGMQTLYLAIVVVMAPFRKFVVFLSEIICTIGLICELLALYGLVTTHQFIYLEICALLGMVVLGLCIILRILSLCCKKEKTRYSNAQHSTPNEDDEQSSGNNLVEEQKKNDSVEGVTQSTIEGHSDS